jgi:hypothetical protein
MIYFSLNYVVLCTRPSRPRPQLYDMDGRYHSRKNAVHRERRPSVRDHSLREKEGCPLGEGHSLE